MERKPPELGVAAVPCANARTGEVGDAARRHVRARRVGVRRVDAGRVRVRVLYPREEGAPARDDEGPRIPPRPQVGRGARVPTGSAVLGGVDPFCVKARRAVGVNAVVGNHAALGGLRVRGLVHEAEARPGGAAQAHRTENGAVTKSPVAGVRRGTTHGVFLPRAVRVACPA